MIKSESNLSAVKTAVKECFGKAVSVTVNTGRNRIVTFCGILTGVYPALFTVRPENGFRGRTSFSYSEIMCGNVTIIRRA